MSKEKNNDTSNIYKAVSLGYIGLGVLALAASPTRRSGYNMIPFATGAIVGAISETDFFKNGFVAKEKERREAKSKSPDIYFAG